MWCIVLIGCLTMVAMAGLLSLRLEHNLFEKAWSGLMHAQAAQALQSIRLPAGAGIKPESGAVRKCASKGVTVYSNVACRASDVSSREVDLQDTKGFEPPSVSTLAAPKGESPPSLQDKMIEQVIRQR